MKIRILIVAGLLAGGPVAAQVNPPIEGGTSGRAAGSGDVSASTYGAGSTDGSSIGVTGGGDAEAAAGGTATTDSRARLTERRASQRSVARSRDEDERARSRTRTVVRNGEHVRSRSLSVYRQKGEKPVVTKDYYDSRKPNPGN